MDIALLGIKISASGVTRTTKDLSELARQGGKTEKATRGLDKGSAKLNKTLKSHAVRNAAKDSENLGRQHARTDRATTSLAGSTLRLSGAFAGLSAVAVLVSAVKLTADFGQAMADLSAITGATGKDLEFYKEQAKDIGTTTSLSASQAASAFKLIASAKPDLLESADALNAVTRSAVTLAEATGQDLPTAAKALGSALNQFQLPAKDAEKIINILAASSKLGTAEVDNVTEALRNAGPAANSLGLDFAETVAGIQALAKSGREGADAGTALRQVMLKLEATGNKKLQPSLNGLVGSMNELKSLNLSNTELMKLFGVEAFTAATSLLVQSDTLETLNSTLRGTDTAHEQASIRMDTLTGDTKELKSALEGLALAVTEDFVPSLRTGVQGLTSIVNELQGFDHWLGVVANKHLGIDWGFEETTTDSIIRLQDQIAGLQDQLAGTDDQSPDKFYLRMQIAAAQKEIKLLSKSISTAANDATGKITLLADTDKKWMDQQIKGTAAGNKRSTSIFRSSNSVRKLSKEITLLSKADKDWWQDSLEGDKKLLKSWDDQIRRLGLTAREIAKETALKELSALADEDQIELMGRKVDAYYEQLDAIQQVNDAAERSAIEQHEQQLAIQKQYEETAKKINDAFTNTFRTLLDGGKDTFSNLVDSAKSMVKDIIAELLTLAARPFIIQIAGASAGLIAGSANAEGLTGALGGGGLDVGSLSSGIKSLVGGNSIGESFTGAGQFLQSTFGGSDGAFLANNPSFAGATGQSALFSNAGNFSNIAYGATGIIAGFLGDKLFGGKGGTGASLGSTLGLAAGGPIGALLGGLAGGALGGLFGNKKPSSKLQSSSIDLTSGDFRYRPDASLTGKKFSQENKDASLVAAEYVSQFARVLTKISGETLSGELAVGVGSRDGVTLSSNGVNRFSTHNEDDFKAKLADFLGDAFNVDLTVYKEAASLINADIITTITSVFAISEDLTAGLGIFTDNLTSGINDFTHSLAGTTDDNLISVIETINSYSQENESLIDTYARLSAETSVLSSSLDFMTLSFSGSASDMVAFADDMTEASGGLEQVSGLWSSYFGNFYTDQERAQKALEQGQNKLNDFMQAAGLDGLDLSVDNFRDRFESALEGGLAAAEAVDWLAASQFMIEVDGLASSLGSLSSIDFGGLMSDLQAAVGGEVAAADSKFNSISSGISSRIAVLDEDLSATIAGLTGQQDQLKASYQSTQNSLKSSISLARTAVSNTSSVFEIITSALNNIASSSGTLLSHSRAQSELVALSLGGGIPDANALRDVIAGVGNPSTSLFSSFTDFSKDSLITANALTTMQSTVGDQLSTDESILASLESSAVLSTLQFNAGISAIDDQIDVAEQLHDEQVDLLNEQLEQASMAHDAEISALNSTLDYWQRLIDIETGALDATLSLADAIANLQQATGSNSQTTNSQFIDQLYSRGLAGTDYDGTGSIDQTEGKAYWQSILDSGVSRADLIADFKRISENQYGVPFNEHAIPGFAAGGVHSGGVRLVGEKGPELEFTGSSRIVSNSKSKELLDNSQVTKAVADLQEVTRAGNYAIAKFLSKATKILDKWDRDGQPEVRTV